jgi:hypothetical protein
MGKSKRQQFIDLAKKGGTRQNFIDLARSNHLHNQNLLEKLKVV